MDCKAKYFTRTTQKAKFIISSLLVISACLTSGPQESIKPVYEPTRMTGMNGNEK